MSQDAAQFTAAVVGGGLMGSGIAAQLALAGVPTQVHDTAPLAQERVAQACRTVCQELQAAGRLSAPQADGALARIRFEPRLEALADATLVIEAIPEHLPSKHALYAALEAVLPDTAVLASSTSGYPPDELARQLRCPQRFLVAHFWNPPHLIPLVEVVPAQATGAGVVAQVMQQLVHCGCEPVLLHKAVPGFIGNRIQFAVLREALHLLGQGVADAATIDRVVSATLGRRYRQLGPLEGADAGGLDTFLAIATHLMPELARDEQVLALLQERVDKGHLGRKSGEGFYRWDAQRHACYAQARLRMADPIFTHPGESPA